MKPSIRSSDIQTLSDYRKNLAEHHEKLRETGRPLFVTNNGRTAAVVLSPEKFDEMLAIVEQQETVEGLKRALAEVKAGRTMSEEELRQGLRKRYGLKV